MPKSFVGEPFKVSLISGIESFRLQRVMSRFSVENCLSHSTETFRRGTFLCCFRNFLVTKKFMDKKERVVSKFPSKNFCLTMPKNAVGEPFILSLISGIEKVWMRGWGGGGEGGVPKFSVENFLSHSAENFRRGTP